jgi:BlaI family transcriptional regulator, penicillinase repressor
MKGRPMGKSPTQGKASRPTDAELEILRVLWRLGDGTVREVHEAVTAGQKRTTFNTTLKMLHIMLEKGLVTRQDARRPHIYQPAIPEEQMQQRLVSDLLDRAFGGAARKLVAALAATDISDEELADIRQLLNEHGDNNNEDAN